MRRRDWGTSRSPGAPGWAPADKEQESNPQVLEPIKGTSLIASLNIVPQVSGNAGTTVVCTVLILPVLDLCFMILSLITQFHLFFSFSLYGINDAYLMSCYIPFLCGYEASLHNIHTSIWGWGDSFPVGSVNRVPRCSHSSDIFFILQLRGWGTQQLSEKPQLQFSAYVLASQELHNGEYAVSFLCVRPGLDIFPNRYKPNSSSPGLHAPDLAITPFFLYLLSFGMTLLFFFQLMRKRYGCIYISITKTVPYNRIYQATE